MDNDEEICFCCRSGVERTLRVYDFNVKLARMNGDCPKGNLASSLTAMYAACQVLQEGNTFGLSQLPEEIAKFTLKRLKEGKEVYYSPAEDHFRTATALHWGSLASMELLVKYADCCAPTEQWPPLEVEIAHQTVRKLIYVLTFLHNNSEPGTILQTDGYILHLEWHSPSIYDDEIAFEELMASDFFEKKPKRVFLVIKVIEALVRLEDKHPSAENYLKCLKLYFAAIPDPYVTYQETETVLTILQSKEPLVRMLKGVLRLRYSVFFKEYDVEYQARDLFHLTRCALRRHLRGSLLEAAEELKIPKILRDSLQCMEAVPSDFLPKILISNYY